MELMVVAFDLDALVKAPTLTPALQSDRRSWVSAGGLALKLSLTQVAHQHSPWSTSRT